MRHGDRRRQDAERPTPDAEAPEPWEPGAPAERGRVEAQRPHADDPGGARRRRESRISALPQREQRRWDAPRAPPESAPRVSRDASGIRRSALRRKPSSVEDNDGAEGPEDGPRAPGAASGRSMDRGEPSAEAEDHGGGEADLEQVAGEERHEPDAERRRGGSPPSSASCATPPAWMTTMPRAQAPSARSTPGPLSPRARRSGRRPRGKASR